jgi:hypothetical protein
MQITYLNAPFAGDRRGGPGRPAGDGRRDRKPAALAGDSCWRGSWRRRKMGGDVFCDSTGFQLR